jgi:hypothetical protein
VRQGEAVRGRASTRLRDDRQSLARGTEHARLALAALALTLAASGCGSGFQMRLPDTQVVPTRTILLAVSAEAYDIDFGNNVTERVERGAEMQRSISREVERHLKAKGVRLIPDDTIRACDSQCKSMFSTLLRWGDTATREIAAQRHGRLRTGRTSVGQWRSPRDLAPLRGVLDADFGLTVYLFDTCSSPGRSVGHALIGYVDTTVKQLGIACVLELSTGRMVWCASAVGKWWGDLTTTTEARRAVEDLLSDL